MPVQYNWQGARRQGKAAVMEKMLREFNILYGTDATAQKFSQDFYKKGSNPCRIILDLKPGDYRVLSNTPEPERLRIRWRNGWVYSAPSWSELLVPVSFNGKHWSRGIYTFSYLARTMTWSTFSSTKVEKRKPSVVIFDSVESTGKTSSMK